MLSSDNDGCRNKNKKLTRQQYKEGYIEFRGESAYIKDNVTVRLSIKTVG